jgi:hypothetical protein
MPSHQIMAHPRADAAELLAVPVETGIVRQQQVQIPPPFDPPEHGSADQQETG